MTGRYHPEVDINSLLQQKYEHWRFPESFSEVVDFAINFNGHVQPVVHDYPWSLPTIAIILYWVVIYFGPKYMENKTRLELKFISILWNLFLFILSVGMFLGMVEAVFLFIYNNGFYELVCMPNGQLYYGIPFFCIWLFALSKYIELFDTVILILRKKPLSFLHWYHHTTVLAYTWFSMVILSPPGAIFGLVNTFVHTIMYFYYFSYEAGLKPRWGKLVTVIQLLQMLIGLVTSSFWTYFYLTGAKCPMHSPDAYLISTLLLYLSYFALFYNFYRKRYVKPITTAKPSPSSNSTPNKLSPPAKTGSKNTKKKN